MIHSMHTVEKHEGAKKLHTGPGKLARRLKQAGWNIEDKLETTVICNRAVMYTTNLYAATRAWASHGASTKDCRTS